MKVVVYIRAEDERFLDLKTQGETPRWVRSVVRKAIKMMKEQDERVGRDRPE